jgi:hypothetical protein
MLLTAGMPLSVEMQHQRLLQHHSDVANSRDASKIPEKEGMPVIARMPSKDCSKQKHWQQHGHYHNQGQNCDVVFVNKLL